MIRFEPYKETADLYGDSVPQGRLNLAQDVVLGRVWNVIQSRRDGWQIRIFQPSLRD